MSSDRDEDAKVVGSAEWARQKILENLAALKERLVVGFIEGPLTDDQLSPVPDPTSVALNGTRLRLKPQYLAALQAIEGGTYGTCEVCGEQIDIEKRLKHIWWATRCCRHQKEWEEMNGL